MKTVLFVCVENSCRSQIAEAFANIYGQDTLEAHSAGSHPSGQVNIKAINSMQEVGYDLARHHSKSLTNIPQINYDLVITMGCGDECPNVAARQKQDWDIPDPKNMNIIEFRQIREIIKNKAKNNFRES